VDRVFPLSRIRPHFVFGAELSDYISQPATSGLTKSESRPRHPANFYFGQARDPGSSADASHSTHGRLAKASWLPLPNHLVPPVIRVEEVAPLVEDQSDISSRDLSFHDLGVRYLTVALRAPAVSVECVSGTRRGAD
jgi:hypothetical protein